MPNSKRGAQTEACREPIDRFVVTIPVDGRELQTVTEWWASPPPGVRSWPNPAGSWTTSRIYDPETRVSYWPPRPASSPPTLSP